MLIREGDTLESIARRVYGDERKAADIRRANPGLGDVLKPGDVIAIPGAPTSASASSTVAASENAVEITIDGVTLKHWQAVRIRRSIDTVSTVEVIAPFDPDDKTKRRVFRPFSYLDASVKIGGGSIFKGTLISVDPMLDNTSNTVSAAFYGLPGVLADCTAPASAYAERNGAIEWDNSSFAVILEDVARMFGLKVILQDDAGAPFERVGLGPNVKVMGFLTELAAQRNLVINDTPEGALRVQKAVVSGAPIANIEAGAAGPIVEVSAMFNPQEYYSHITGIAPVIIGLAGTQYTVKNTRLGDKVRPYTFDSQDLLDTEIKQSVESKIGRMFANAVSYRATAATWRDQSGKLWEPNTIIKLKAPRVMIYKPFDFLIRGVQFDKNADSETAILDLVLIGSLAGQIPGKLPWDE